MPLMQHLSTPRYMRSMATDKQQTPAPGEREADGQQTDRNAPTQVGQVIQELGRLTRRLPTTRTRRTNLHQRHHHAPPREQLVALIDALGDPEHPDHGNAVDLLVEIGPPVVPALNEALNPQRPWLTAYRAAEALGRIGDGRAVGPLIQALRHPNSNVRWNAVRALSQVGDVRAILELRRVAQEDHGRTSWGEAVAGAAQSTLDQMQSKSVWGQSIELIKTAVTCVLMILSLIFAFSVISTLRNELDSMGRILPGEVVENVRTPLPTATVAPTSTPAATVEPTPEAANALPAVLTGTVLQTSNVRPFPATNNQPIGQLREGDEVIFLARTADGNWYRVRLGTRVSDASTINNPDGSGSGWVNRLLLSSPDGDVPVETVTAAPGTAATPAP